MTGLIIQGLINGLILGAIYGLIGVGLNVIFGVLRVVNFAHGEFLVLGAYFAFYLLEYLGINPLLALPLAFAVFFLAGYLLYFVLIPRLSKAEDPEISSLLLMFGVSIMLGAIMLLAFEADARSLPYEIEPVFLKFGPVLVPTVRLLALGIALAIVAALALFLYRTHLGSAARHHHEPRRGAHRRHQRRAPVGRGLRPGHRRRPAACWWRWCSRPSRRSWATTTR